MTIYTTEHSALTEEKKPEHNTDNELEIFVDDKLLANLDNECNLVYRDPVVPIRKSCPKRQRSWRSTVPHLCMILAVLLTVTLCSIAAVFTYRIYSMNWYWCQVAIPSNYTFDYNYVETDVVQMSEWMYVGDDVEEMRVHKLGSIVPPASIKHDFVTNQTAIRDTDTNRCYIAESHEYLVEPEQLQSLMGSRPSEEMIFPAEVVTLNYTVTNNSRIDMSLTIEEHCGSSDTFVLTPGFTESSTTSSYMQYTGKLLLHYRLHDSCRYIDPYGCLDDNLN